MAQQVVDDLEALGLVWVVDAREVGQLLELRLRVVAEEPAPPRSQLWTKENQKKRGQSVRNDRDDAFRANMDGKLTARQGDLLDVLGHGARHIVAKRLEVVQGGLS